MNQRSNCWHSLGHGESMEFQKTFSASLTAVKSSTMWITTDRGKVLKRWKYQTTLPVSWETCMRGKKQQLEPGIEPLTTSQLGNEWDKAVYCHPAYLISMQIISCKMPGWMNPKLKGLLMKLDKPKSHERVKFSKKTKERREGELTYFLCLHRGSFFFILCTLFIWISIVPCESHSHQEAVSLFCQCSHHSKLLWNFYLEIASDTPSTHL